MTLLIKYGTKVSTMRLQNSKFFLFIALVMSMANAGQAEIINHEDAIETNEIMIVGSQANGYVLARKCDDCPQLRLQLSVNTKAYQNGQQVPMSRVPNRVDTAITVIYDPKTNVVNRIKW